VKDILPHPEQQRSYAELREEFRAEALSNLKKQMTCHHLNWSVIGDPEKSRAKFTAYDWTLEMLKHLDDPCSQSFNLNSVPDKLWSRLSRYASESLLHESATWDDSVAGVTDHDAPPMPDPFEMSDDEICDYVEKVVKEGDTKCRH